MQPFRIGLGPVRILVLTQICSTHRQKNYNHWVVVMATTYVLLQLHYFSYFLMLVSWLHPFKIAHGSYTQQLKYVKIQVFAESIWQRVHNKKACMVSIP